MNKKSIVYGGLFVLMQLLLIISPWRYVSEKYQTLESHDIERLQNAYQISVESYRRMANLLHNEIVMHPNVLKWMAEAKRADLKQQNVIRERLYHELKASYDALQQFDLRQLHFHLPDGTSFLRFHRPEQFGDNLFSIRHSIKQVNITQQPVHGFEEGRIYNGFRYVFPLFYNQEHVGSVETSVSFPAIEKSMQQVVPAELMLLLKKQVVMERVFIHEQDNYQTVPLSEDYVEETVAAKNHQRINAVILSQINMQLSPQVQTQLQQEQAFVKTIKLSGKNYVSVFIPLKNTQNQVVGYVAAYQENNQFAELRAIFYIRYLELTLFNGLAFTFFILLLKSKEKISKQMGALAQANHQIQLLNEALQADNLRMTVELAVTKQLQQMILPRPEELAQIESLEIASFMIPATEVGGDYYDILQDNGHVKIGIGDVTGHGLESGVLMMMVQTAVRALLSSRLHDSKSFLTVLNNTLYCNLQRMQSDKNLTLVLLDYYQGTLCVTGQHEEILYITQSGQIERIDTFALGFMVGVEPDISDFITEYKLYLKEGDGVVLYTDGITEAVNEENQQFGIERLCEVIRTHWKLSAEEIQQAVLDTLYSYIGTCQLQDDVTLLVIKQK